MDYKSLLSYVYDHASEESTSFITINTSTLRLQAKAPLPHPPATLVPFSVSWEELSRASIALRRHVIDAIKDDLAQNDELRIVIQRCDLTSLDDVHVLVVHAARKANEGDKQLPIANRSVEMARKDEERRVDTSGVSGKPPVPISDLPISCGTLVFKGKVSRKTSIQMYSSGRGELFSFVVSDASGEIEVVAFSGACRKFFACVENGKEYVFRAGKRSGRRPLFNGRGQTHKSSHRRFIDSYT